MKLGPGDNKLRGICASVLCGVRHWQGQLCDNMRNSTEPTELESSGGNEGEQKSDCGTVVTCLGYSIMPSIWTGLGL